MIRDLDLSQEKADLLESMLQQWTKRDLLPSFENKNNLVLCRDINDLMKNLNLEDDPNEWLLFIDSSILCLKAVLLHNENRLALITIGHAVHM